MYLFRRRHGLEKRHIRRNVRPRLSAAAFWIPVIAFSFGDVESKFAGDVCEKSTHFSRVIGPSSVFRRIMEHVKQQESTEPQAK